MIDFSKTEEQELLIESIKELLEREMPAEKERECYRNGEFPWDAWKAMAEAGFTGLGLPEEVGGTDVDLMTVALANFTISRYGGPLAAFYSMGMPTMYDVCEFGTPEQIEKYVKPYIAGGAPLALGISEPSTGSDVAGMQTSYAWDGDTAVINGGKHYTTCGMEAPAIIVIAKDPMVDNVHRGATMFLVDRDTPGVTINKLPKMGHENAPTSICEVFLNDVRVPRSAILGVEHNGFMQTMANFTRERIANVSGVIATAVNAFEDACAYANQREQFGQQIGRFELVQEMIMEMSCKIENMMNMLYKLCWQADQGQDVRILAGMAKYYCSKATCEVVDDAIQVLAGIGVVGDHRVGRYYIDIRSARIAGGSDQVMVFNTAPQILKRYRQDARTSKGRADESLASAPFNAHEETGSACCCRRR